VASAPITIGASSAPNVARDPFGPKSTIGCSRIQTRPSRTTGKAKITTRRRA